MAGGGYGYSFRDNDWARLRQIIQKLASVTLGPQSTPEFGSITLGDLSASRLVGTDASKVLQSEDIADWITGTANQVIVTDDSDGTVTLSAPQDIHTGATPSFSGLTILNDGNITGTGNIVPAGNEQELGNATDNPWEKLYVLEIFGNLDSAININSDVMASGKLDVSGVVTAGGGLITPFGEYGTGSTHLLGTSTSEFDVAAYYTAVAPPAGANKHELKLSGKYVGTAGTYTFKITDATAGAEQFQWKLDAGAFSANVAVSATFVLLTGGMMFAFTDSGSDVYVLNDEWTFDATNTPVVAFNVDTSANIVTVAGALTVDKGTAGTDAVITFDGSSDTPGTFTYESDNGKFLINNGLTVDTDTLVVDDVSNRVKPLMIEFVVTTDDSTGIIYKGANRFIHNFQHPTGNTAIPQGHNTFIGENAGNFTMGSGAVGIHMASDNVGIGFETLSRNSLGWSNLAIGSGALKFNLNGINNLAFGSLALEQCINGSNNIALGAEALRFAGNGLNNVGVGAQTGFLNTGSGCVFLGAEAGRNQTAASNLLIIDNRNRGSIAAELTNSLIYGVFDADPANQSLRINGGLQVVGTAGFGDDAGNETLFSATGVQTMAGTARVIRSVNLEASSAGENPGGAAFPDDDYIDDFFFHRFSASVEEGVTFHWEVPHDYASDGLIHLHNEWLVRNPPTTEGDKVVRIGIEYKKISVGEVFSFAGAATLFINETIAQGETADIIHLDGGVEFVTTGWEPGDVILIRLYRDATSGIDTYDFNIAPSNVANDVWMYNHHLEYLSDKIGEAS